MEMGARLEGLVLDPVYTAKGFAALIDFVRNREPRGPTVFVHTGGLPAVFAYGSILRWSCTFPKTSPPTSLLGLDYDEFAVLPQAARAASVMRRYFVFTGQSSLYRGGAATEKPHPTLR